MICKSCKKVLEDTWVACPFCGTSIKKAPVKRAKSHGNGMGGAIKMPNGTWKARVTVGWTDDNKPIVKTKSGFKTKLEALQAVSLLKLNPNTVTESMTLQQLYDQWEPFYEPRIGETTMATYRAAYKHFHSIHNMRLYDITIDELQQCVDDAVESGKGRSTINNMRTVVSLLYEYADMKRIKVDNLSRHIYVGSVSKGTRNPITEKDLETIRQAIGREMYAEYIYCLCYLGYRPGEMLEMKKAAYDQDNHYFVGGKKTEAGKNRIVTVSPKILPFVEHQLSTPGEFMFPRLDKGHEGQAMTDEHFREVVFKPLMKRLGIKDDITPYSGRHTFANKLKGVSGSDTDKASLIGHADASMTKYYQSADLESLRRITDNLV